MLCVVPVFVVGEVNVFVSGEFIKYLIYVKERSNHRLCNASSIPIDLSTLPCLKRPCSSLEVLLVRLLANISWCCNA